MAYVETKTITINEGLVAFISDTHILLDTDRDAKIIKNIKNFVDNANYSAVFLVGDIFECWKFGNFSWNMSGTVDKFYEATKMYPDLLKILMNPKVYFLHGNHDYCMRNAKVDFDVYTNIKLNGNILITHGNNADNYNNEALAKGRSRFLVIFDWLTERLYHLLGVNKIKTDNILSDVVFAASNRDDLYYKWADNQSADVVVMGHTHRPQITELSHVKYVNIGSGYDQFEYVVYDPKSGIFRNERKLLTF